MFVAMLTADHLLRVVDAYREAHRVSDPRVSTMMFNDGKRIGLLRKGGDIGSRSLVVAFQWLSDRWPDGAVWPQEIPRPAQTDPVDVAPSSGALLATEVPASVHCRSNAGFKPAATGTQSR